MEMETENKCELYGILSYLAKKKIIDAPSNKYPHEVSYLLYVIRQLCLWKDKEDSMQFGGVKADLLLYMNEEQMERFGQKYNEIQLREARLYDWDRWSQHNINEMRTQVKNAIINKLKDRSDNFFE